jgi:transcription initiation factor TFIID subunit 10
MAANPATDNAEQMAAPTAGPNGTQPTGDATSAEATAAPAPPAQEARLPTRKDASLKEFLNKMDDYAPIVRWPAEQSEAPLSG